MALVRFCFASLLLCVLLVLRVQTCSEAGKFGPLCAYTCHCNVQCDQGSGQCPDRCVQPWSGPSCQRENVAYNKTAYSNSVYLREGPWTEEKAVDGNTDQNAGANSCFHSSLYDSPGSTTPAREAWFYLDLGRQYRTHDITFYGRKHTVYPVLGPYRLNNTRLFVSNTANDRNNSCFTFTEQTVVNLTCDREGRYLTLYTNHLGRGQPFVLLEICELEVYVCSNGSYGNSCDKLCHCKNGLACDDVTGRCPQGCMPGFIGDACSTHVDECARPVDVCGESAFCVNTPGSFLCVPFSCTTRPDEYQWAQTGDVYEEVTCCVNASGSFLCLPLNYTRDFRDSLVSGNSSWSQKEVEGLVGGVAGTAVLLLLLQMAFVLYLYRRRKKYTTDMTKADQSLRMSRIYSPLSPESTSE